MSTGTAKMLTPNDVATWLRVSRSWVYAAAADGRIPSIRLGGPDGPLRFIPADVDAWLEEAQAAWSPARREAEVLRVAARRS